MHHKLIFLIVSFFTISGYGRKFEFDTFTEYEYIKDDKSPTYKTFELTNSKDNSYIVSVVEKDALDFVLFFKNGKGLNAATVVSRKDFFRAENINIDCKKYEMLVQKRLILRIIIFISLMIQLLGKILYSTTHLKVMMLK